MKTDIHRPGRKPTRRSPEFYQTLLSQYQTMTTRQLATIYRVSAPTICNWLRKAREENDGTGTEPTETESL